MPKYGIFIYIYICTHALQIIYPLAPSIDYSTHLTKLLILKREWIIKKFLMRIIRLFQVITTTESRIREPKGDV